MFRKYVKTFLTAKIKNSGFPKDIITDSQKDEYIRSLKDKYGIRLSKEEIVFNAGARYISKICLNCLWYV